MAMSSLSRFSGCLVAFLACAGLAENASAQTCPGLTWQRVSPNSAGWSSKGLKDADALAREIGTDSYVVIQGGKIIWEYGAANLPTSVHSVRKSIASVLFGIANDEGKVHLDRTLAELGIDDIGEALSATEKTATVRILLSARSCIYHKAASENESMERKRPERHSCKPGEQWYYNNWDFNSLGTIYKAETGRTIFDDLDQRLAKPLQFEHFDMARDTQFHKEPESVHPAYRMRLSALDLARIGLLMARGGDWCGRRIVSSRWVDESTSAISQTDRATGYGYLWWVGANGKQFEVKFPGRTYSARGNHGQFMIVNPAMDLVIVHRVNSDVRGAKVGSKDFGRLLKTIMAAKQGA
jgi:CubicO group peptidase (beta-lactamase class C family)